MRKVLLSLVCLVALTGCVTVPPNPIDAQSRNGVFVKDVSTSWSVDDAKRADNTAYVQGKQDLVARLKASVEQEFKASPSGAEPVEFDIDVKGYSRVGAAMGNLIGGSNMVVADVTVKRQSDGKILGVYQNVMGAYSSNAGIIGAIAQAMTKPDVVGIMANSFASNLRGRFNGA